MQVTGEGSPGIAQVENGNWENLEYPEGIIAPGNTTARARIENNIIRISGTVEVDEEKEVKVGEHIATLPQAIRELLPEEWDNPEPRLVLIYYKNEGTGSVVQGRIEGGNIYVEEKAIKEFDKIFFGEGTTIPLDRMIPREL